MKKNSFGRKIKELRKAKGFTQAKLAELAGANEKHISKIETGVYFPTFSTLTKILNALDINIENLEINSILTDNPFYIKSLQILNNAKNENELKFYYAVLKEMQEGIKTL